ncbi:hypothetical protein [Methyloferula stellata]|uniref:hypothetical protein n=1 Tax=Methyloferula stellata TaxID=876270 RepID=UPI00037C6142|nr:hypothetical protein [Methyloferula stellata]
MDEQVIPGRRRQLAIAKAVREVKRLLIMVLYLYVVFGLYVLDETVILGREHINFATHGFAIINALVMAKVLLVAEDMSFADRFKDRPLIYPILYKALAFSVLFIAFHVAESVLLGLWHGKSAAESVPQIGGGTLKGWLCVVAILFVSLAPFFAFREIGRVIGEDALWDLMFKRRSKSYKLRPMAD